MRIQVQPERIDDLRSRLMGIKNACDESMNKLNKIKTNLDWQVSARSSIHVQFNHIANRLNKQSEIMNNYAGFLTKVNTEYMAKDEELQDKAKNIQYMLSQILARFQALPSFIEPKFTTKIDQAFALTMGVGALFGAAQIAQVQLTVKKLTTTLQEATKESMDIIAEQERTRIEQLHTRYISQHNPDDNGYWGSYINKDTGEPLPSGCNVASISMALGEIGIDMLPKDICAINDRLRTNPGHSSMWVESYGEIAKASGCEVTSNISFETALMHYQSAPEKYAPPVVKVEEYMHYVVVTGIDANGNYIVRDPSKYGSYHVYSTNYQVIQYYKE